MEVPDAVATHELGALVVRLGPVALVREVSDELDDTGIVLLTAFLGFDDQVAARLADS